MAGNANKAAIDEALAFVQIVKNTFQTEHEKYDEFVDILKNYLTGIVFGLNSTLFVFILYKPPF